MLGILAAAGFPAISFAQTFGPAFNQCYTYRDLGSPQNVLTPLGGVNFVPGNNNMLLIGGAGNEAEGVVYRVPVVRDAFGHIIAFGGAGVQVCTAPYLDGGLAIAPNGTLFITTYSDNQLLQIPQGATSPASTIYLDEYGVASSTGTCQFVPAGFPGEGHLKIMSYSTGDYYDFVISSPTNGVYQLTRNSSIDIPVGGGPEGLVFIGAGNPAFRKPSCLIAHYSEGVLAAYDLDAAGNPIVSTKRVFMNELQGALGGLRDPVTGDFIFSTFGGGNRVIVIQGFNLNCAANFNFDCGVDFFDYLDFLEAFIAAGPDADFNHDGVVDLFDYLDFLAAFSAGC